MKKILNEDIIASYMEKCSYQDILKEIPAKLFLTEYQNGEYLTAPFQTYNLFQIVVSGKVDIYFVRDDGTRYSLSSSNTEYLLGDTEFFREKNENIYAEAIQNVTCLALSIDGNREKLLDNNTFLRFLAGCLAEKMQMLATFNAAPVSMEERVLSYMKYKCETGILKGIEQAAFHLHCSARQLQRVMNRQEAKGTVIKLGKGTYQLTELSHDKLVNGKYRLRENSRQN